MLRALDISTSGLVAQRQRMNTIAGNIANVSSTRDEHGNITPYQRRFVEFYAEQMKNGETETQVSEVKYRVKIDTQTPPRPVYQPGHRDSDENDMVYYPNINVINEFANAIEASRAYEANVVTMQMTKQMAEMGLRILS